MGRFRARDRSREDARMRDRWYEARENEREWAGYNSDESESEPESLPAPEQKPENPSGRIIQLLDKIQTTQGSIARINIISELMHVFISSQEYMRSSGENAYKRFTVVVQAKCAEFAAHPDAQGNQGFQDLLKQVANLYR